MQFAPLALRSFARLLVRYLQNKPSNSKDRCISKTEIPRPDPPTDNHTYLYIPHVPLFHRALP